MAKGVKRGKASKSDGGAADVAEGKTHAESVAERAMPGWTAVPPSGPLRSFGASADAANSPRGEVDAVMPSTEALHRKFYGTDGADAPAPPVPTKMLGDKVEDRKGRVVAGLSIRQAALRRVHARVSAISWIGVTTTSPPATCRVFSV